MSVPSSALERLSSARVWLNARVPFLGYLTLQLRPRIAHVGEDVPTVAVAPDGTLVLNEAYVAGLTEAQFRFLVAHEVLHPALNFWGRLKKRNFRRFNEAHDHAINLILEAFRARLPEGEFERPPDALFEPAYGGWSAEQIYDHLLRCEKAARTQAEAAATADPSCEGGSGAKGDAPRAASSNRRAPAPTKPSPATDCRSDLRDAPTEARERLTWRLHVATARTTHNRQYGRGSLPQGVDIVIDQLLEPYIDWRTALSNWIGEHALREEHSYQRPARRSESVGELLPSILRRSTASVTVLWDTSGSMYGTEAMIFAEVGAILEELRLSVRLITCDCVIQADVEGLDDVEACRRHVRGGGGSDFSPAFERLDAERDTSVVIAFTDGEIYVPLTKPESLAGVLWVLTPVGIRPASWGEVLHLDPNDEGESEA